MQNNRDAVEKATGGQIAYVHIRAMDQPSLERFQNEIDRYWQKKGIIIDVRFNTGGNIDDELLDIIERRPYMFTNQRTGARTWGRRPQQAIAGPKVMMINQRSFSDAEATPMGFRTLGLGTHRRHADGRRRHLDGQLLADQRRHRPHAGSARGGVRPDEAEQLRHRTSRTTASRPTCGCRTRSMTR